MRITVACAVVASVACAACASQPTAPSGPENAPGNIFTPDTTFVSIHLAGGLGPAPGVGSTCTPALEDYTYVLATRALAWSICRAPTPGGVYRVVPGNATLTSAQATDLVDALGALEQPDLPSGQSCGGDFSEMFTFTTPNGTKTYGTGDCLMGGNAVFDAISAVTH